MRKIKPVSNYQRNGLHDHPLLRKCEAHVKTHKRKRANEKVNFKREYVDQSASNVVF